MQLVITIFLVAAAANVPWPAPLFSGTPADCGMLMAGILGLLLVRAYRLATTTCQVLRQPFRQAEALHVYHRGRVRFMFALLAAYAVALTFGGWGWAIRQTLSGDDGELFPAAELVTVAPFLLALVASWWLFYPVEREVTALSQHRPLSRWGYLRFQFRQQLVLSVAVLALAVIEQSLLRVFPAWGDSPWFTAVTLGIIGLLVVAAPWALRWFLGLRPLPDCELRERLKSVARRANFRCSDFMIWPTRGTMANALIVGLLPRPRYVVFTDRLLAEFTPEEVEGVLGHEMGHIRHHHLLYYAAFASLSYQLFNGTIHALDVWLSGHEWAIAIADKLAGWDAFIALGVMAGYFGIVFGMVSRRCEREADLFGARVISCDRLTCLGHEENIELPTVSKWRPPCPTGAETFMGALERVAAVNDISRDKPGWLSSWQHGTIAKRVEFLDRIRREPQADAVYRQKMLGFKTGLLLLLGVGVGALYYAGHLTWPWA